VLDVVQRRPRLGVWPRLQIPDRLIETRTHKKLYVKSTSSLEVNVLYLPQRNGVKDIAGTPQKKGTPVEILEIVSSGIGSPTADLFFENRVTFSGREFAEAAVEFSAGLRNAGLDIPSLRTALLSRMLK
jgi:hypothetical protein